MRLFGIISLILILLIVGALAAPQFIDWNQYKGQVIAQVKANTGFEAEIGGNLDLAVLPVPRVVVNDLSLKNPAEEEPLITLSHADVYLDIMPLLSGNVALKSITLNKPEISLRVAKNGEANWVTDQLQFSQEQAAEPAEETAPPSSSSDVAIGSLSIEEGRLSYRDLQSGTEYDIQNINGTFSMDSLQGPFDVAAEFETMGMPLNIDATTERLDAENESVSANVKAGVQGAEVNFSGVIGYGNEPDVQGETTLSIANLKSFLEGITGSEQADYLDQSFQAKGILTASADSLSYTNMNASFNKQNLSGTVHVKGLSTFPKKATANVDLTGSDNTVLKSSINIADNSYKFNDLTFQHKASDLTGTFGVSTAGKTMDLNADVRSTNLNVDELYQFIGMPKPTISSGKKVSLKQSMSEVTLPFNADVNARIQKLIYAGQIYRGLVVDAKNAGNTVILDNIKLEDYAGLDVEASGRVGNMKSLSELNVNVTINTGSLDHSLEALGQPDLLKSLPGKIGGLKTQAKLEGSIENLSFDTVTNALNGTFSAKGTALDLETKPVFNNITLGLKHPNLARLMQTVLIDGKRNPALETAIDISSQVDMAKNVYMFQNLKGKFGPISFDGNIKADLGSSKPSVTGEFSTGTFPVETFMGETARSTKSAGNGSEVEKWSTAPIDVTWMDSADVDLKLSSSQITYGNWVFKDPSFSLVMKDNTLTINDWSAGLFGGTSQVGLKLTGGRSLKVASDLNLQNVGLQSLVMALTGSPIVQSKGVADVSTSLALSGTSIATLISSLDGEGTVNGTDITIRGIDVAEMTRAMTSTDSLGGQARALFNSGIRGGSSSFETLAGEYSINNGEVTFSKLDLTGEEAIVETNGTVSLPYWTLDMKSSVQLVVDETNEAGEPIEPPPPFEITYRGSLSNPGQSFAQNAIEGYLNKKISAKANKLIQDKLGDKLDSELGGVVGGLLGIKPKQQQQQDATEPQEQQSEPAAGVEEPANDNVSSSPYTPDSVKLDQQQAAQEEEQQQQEQPKKVEPEDIVKDVLKGFLQ